MRTYEAYRCGARTILANWIFFKLALNVAAVLAAHL
jgi:hypothetical protein